MYATIDTVCRCLHSRRVLLSSGGLVAFSQAEDTGSADLTGGLADAAGTGSCCRPSALRSSCGDCFCVSLGVWLGAGAFVVLEGAAAPGSIQRCQSRVRTLFSRTSHIYETFIISLTRSMSLVSIFSRLKAAMSAMSIQPSASIYEAKEEVSSACTLVLSIRIRLTLWRIHESLASESLEK